MMDWDAIQSLGGLTVGGQVRHRGPAMGFIHNLINVEGRMRARRLPTVVFEGVPRGQMDMFEAGNHGW